MERLVSGHTEVNTVVDVCPSGKIAYASRSEARDVVRAMQERGKRHRRSPGRLQARPGFRLNEFKCRHCGWWHVGNKRG